MGATRHRRVGRRSGEPGAIGVVGLGIMGGAMAEALLEEPGRRVLTRLSAAEDLAAPVAARSPLEAMALCGVITRPAAVGRLLESDVASDKEAEAIEALSPTLSACLTGADKAELNAPAMRSIVALAAWRIVTAGETNAVDRHFWHYWLAPAVLAV